MGGPEKAPPVLDRIIEAHGGRVLWDRLEALEAEISARGALFLLKRRSRLVRARMTASTREPRFLMHDYPAAGMTGELVGAGQVRILDGGGRVVARRENPRAALLGPGNLFAWDDLDFLYFCGYATWGYLTAPFLFLLPGVRCEILPASGGAPASWTRLRVTFPPAIPAHCAVQDFLFDERLRLRRLDYVAEVVGGWARAAHLCEEYREFGGYRAPTRRRAYPLLVGSRPLPAPTLVAIDVHAIRPLPRS